MKRSILLLALILILWYCAFVLCGASQKWNDTQIRNRSKSVGY